MSWGNLVSHILLPLKSTCRAKRAHRQHTAVPIAHADDLKMKLFGPHHALVSERAGNRAHISFSCALSAGLGAFSQTQGVNSNWSWTCVKQSSNTLDILQLCFKW